MTTWRSRLERPKNNRYLNTRGDKFRPRSWATITFPCNFDVQDHQHPLWPRPPLLRFVCMQAARLSKSDARQDHGHNTGKVCFPQSDVHLSTETLQKESLVEASVAQKN